MINIKQAVFIVLFLGRLVCFMLVYWTIKCNVTIIQVAEECFFYLIYEE